MDNEELRYYMDETSSPFSEGECPFSRTEADDEFDKKIIEEFHLVTKDMEDDRK